MKTSDTAAELQSRVDELLREKIENDDEARSISNQLQEARQQVRDDGQYSDRVWYRRANDALKHKRRRSQEIQIEVGRLKREIKAMNVASDERAFIEAAQELLPKDVYMEIWELAREKRG